MRAGTALLATVVSGVLHGLAFPTAKLQPLAWIALVPLLLALRGASVRRAVGLAWLWSLVAAYTVGDWFAPSFAQYYHRPLALGVVFFLATATVTSAPYHALFALAYRVLVRRPGAGLPLLAGAAWAAAELARSRLLEIANPWALSAYSQVGLDHLVQIADATGVYGISFLLGTVNAAVAETIAAGGVAPARRGLALAAGLVAATLGYGEWRLRTVVDPPGTPPVRVAMIQANLDLGTVWQPEFYGRNLETYLRLTERVLPERPAVVVWPENALSFYLEDEPLYRAAIAGILGTGGPELLTGGPRAVRGEPPRVFNSIFHLDARGTMRGIYDKERLVPLGEYFPFAALAALRRRVVSVQEFSRGERTAPLVTAAGPAGITICNEAMFPEVAAARVRDGATWLLDPANDTWLTDKFSAQQFEIVTLRAVEQRRWIVRASTAGPSALVDPLGRVRLRTAFATQAAVTGEFVPRTDRTLYARVGDLFAVCCAVAAAAGWARAARA